MVQHDNFKEIQPTTVPSKTFDLRLIKIRKKLGTKGVDISRIIETFDLIVLP